MLSLVAGRPFPLLNCSVVNQTSDSLQVECTESFDGGLPQSFMMEILELPTHRTIMNVTTLKTPPIFSAEGLEAGATYRIHLYAINAKGRSDPTIIDPVTFKGVAKYTSKWIVFVSIYLSFTNHTTRSHARDIPNIWNSVLWKCGSHTSTGRQLYAYFGLKCREKTIFNKNRF